MNILLHSIIYGIVIGMVISAPLGPVGLLCLRETIYGSRREGLLIGVGATLSDTIYALLVYQGVGLILEHIEAHNEILRLIGGFIILIFSYFVYRYAAKKMKYEPTQRLSKRHGLRKVITAFLVTLSNPLIMFLILPLFARFNFVQSNSHPTATLLTAMSSIALGCMLWWTILTYIVQKLYCNIGEKGIKWIGYIVALILSIVGIISIYTGTTGLLR